MAVVRVTPKMVVSAIEATDWRAIDAQTDEEIAANVASDPDAPPILTDSQTAAAIVRSVGALGFRRPNSRPGFTSRSARCVTGSRTGGGRTPLPWHIRA